MQKFNWQQTLANILGAAITAGATGYYATGTVKGGLLAALGAIVYNLSALFQPQPHKSEHGR